MDFIHLVPHDSRRPRDCRRISLTAEGSPLLKKDIPFYRRTSFTIDRRNCLTDNSHKVRLREDLRAV